MKPKIFYILLLFFFTIGTSIISYGNTNTRGYCDELLVHAKSEYLLRNYVKSLEYLEEAQSMLINNEQRTESLNIRALIYKDLGDYEKAMDYFLNAYKITVESNLYKMQSIILNNIAVLHGDKYEVDKALEYYEKAHNVALKSNDSVSIGRTAINIAQIAVESGNVTSAQKYISIAESYIKKDRRLMPYIQIVKCNYLFLKEEYKDAESLALKLLEEEWEIELGQKSLLFWILSKIYYAIGNMEKSIYYTKQTLLDNPIIEESVGAYDRLSKLYFESDSLRLALLYKDSLLIVKDSLHSMSNKESLETYHVRIELLNVEKTLAENRAKQTAERILLLSVLAFAIIIIVILIWTFRIKSIRDQQRKQIAELELEKEKNRKQILEQQYKEQETMALLQQERLNNEIEIKNRQLITKVLFQTNRNKLIDDIIAVFSQHSQLTDNPHIKTLCQELKMLRKESINNGFLVYFEQINPVFFTALRESHPKLSQSDLRMLSYIYLNLSSKEIANLLNVLPDSWKRKKRRLASKLGIDTTQLYDYLSGIV